MNPDVNFVRGLLADHDPADSVRGDTLDRQRTLNAILTEEPARAKIRGRWMSRRRILVVGGALAAAAATVIAADLTRLSGHQTTNVSLATTPPLLEMGKPVYGPAVRTALLDIAAKAARQPDTIKRGKVVYTKTKGWYLNSTVATGRTSAASIVQTQEQWIAPDGSGRQLTSGEVPPWFPTMKSRSEWEKQGRPSVGGKNGDQRYGPGQLSLEPVADTLPTDPAALRQALQKYAAGNTGAVAVLKTIDTLYQEQPIRPRLRAALLRVLAGTGEMGYAGTVQDRAGRSGAAFTLDQHQTGLPERDVVIFDRDTGALLSEEEILTKDPGKLPVHIPSVASYTLYLQSGRADAIDQRP
ncbi:CU044_5270 family protein [Actinoallomurus iriomotensis]|uniref:CU044_5270 family protein n=1 Tax=Actinoallomurus iriomotensis TaxID=478107 RepID=A0A9W6W225_9ACTN|nr:CU044_5270 family protein [Actinoallomurus iriomotensis]GLY86511.1 hypothetical protein Airi02_044400 [Actinoallomurus iriomotensis]